MTKKAIITTHDGREASPITKASNVLFEDGQTAQDILNDRQDTMISPTITTSSSMSKIGQGDSVDYSENVVNGAYESCVLKGRTLVNLSSFKGYQTTTVLSTQSYVPAFQRNVEQYKPNTKYLVITEFDHDFKCRFGVSISHSTTVISSTARIEEDGGKIYKHIITTKSDFTGCDIGLRTVVYGDSTNDITQTYRIMILEYVEGMENWDIPYFEGMCSVKMPILRNVGKNLFDGTVSSTNRRIATSSGGSYASDGYSISQYIQIKPNTTYAVKTQETTYFAFYDKNKQYTNGGGATYKFTTGINSCYVRFDFKSDEIETVQLEESPTPTTYENYKTNILTTPEEIVLRSLPNGVKDTYNAITGEYVQRIGEVVLDGSEDEGWSGFELSNPSAYSYYAIVGSASLSLIGVEMVAGTAICDKLKSVTSSLSSIPENHYSIASKTNNNMPAIIIRLTGNETTIGELKTYLQANPITVQYQLATPITTTIDLQGSPYAYKDGHIQLTSGSIEQSLTPIIEYSLPTNRNGQIRSNQKMVEKHQKELDKLQAIILANLVNSQYNQTLTTLNYELSRV